jgi:hypothetical protein
MPLSVLCAESSLTKLFRDITISVSSWCQEQRLVGYFNALPEEIKHHILFYYFNERGKIAMYNATVVKEYIDVQSSIGYCCPYSVDYQRYYFFKNAGTKCYHITTISLLHSDSYRRDSVVFIHTLKDGKVSTSLDPTEYSSINLTSDMEEKLRSININHHAHRVVKNYVVRHYVATEKPCLCIRVEEPTLQQKDTCIMQ